MALGLAPAPLAAGDPLRIATWHAPLTRKGPGLLLRDLLRGEAPDLAAITQGIAALDADVLLLTDVDYDHGLRALTALNDSLARPYPHLFALRPNTGMPTGRDLDGNGALGEPRDAQGYGWFAGEGGMALLSRLPPGPARDLSGLLWEDLPGTLMTPEDPGAGVQRLSSTGHWVVPLALPGGGTLTLLGFHATPPVFDGPEDRNGRRNHDELALWLRLLEGALEEPPPEGPVVLIGNANLDPARGEGRHEAIRALLTHPRLVDPLPGQPTALWQGGPGPLRVSYVLPDARLSLLRAGLGPILPDAGPHRAVWVSLRSPGPEPPDS
ncbi:endonuclease/exonuclease/phosphatase family protein [Roseivivax sp. GX 12232]|uniref:endonuclease/exonuclease/phosphatase family protein n=1 Tax=Roseivivax sp. GX 12232 TaxID=2900547 RepID=UPI001E5C35AB|nr:endonuclease/exonuclease/phosphatase family protein [Roseivivax sp. GX 12232]MCE0506400.1 endonuclease/exonuclease/phosphatase family protein [Roseivivax sp. GX 12232]